VNLARKKPGKTSTSLLEAASEIFAAKGYRDATIAEICEKAGANIAAVNYHFGDKETLYREAWRYSYLESLKVYPPDGGVSEHASAEERLRGYILSLVRRIADKNNKEFVIIHNELATSTELLKDVIRETVKPLHEKFEHLIRELLGPSSTEMQVRFCTISVISQCTTPLLIRREELKKISKKIGLLSICDEEAYAEHIADFSLTGILALRAKNQAIRK